MKALTALTVLFLVQGCYHGRTVVTPCAVGTCAVGTSCRCLKATGGHCYCNFSQDWKN